MPTRTRRSWRQKAEELGRIVSREHLHRECLTWASNHQSEKWAVAFSGGADSLALLLLLWAHFPSQRRKFVALHFNHRLRGADSEADERFCTRVCCSLGVTLKRGRWLDADAEPSEAEARKARHAFFAEELKKNQTHAVWLGHQQDDIAETMLMRIARGSGTSGLAAPRPMHGFSDGHVHLRPLLTLKKATVLESLEKVGAGWREDRTNHGRKFLRNRMRRDVVGVWKAAAADRDALGGAALSRELLAEDDAALEAWVNAIAPLKSNGCLNLRKLQGKPVAVVRRSLHRWLAAQAVRCALSRQAFTLLLEDVRLGRVTRHSLGSGMFAEITKKPFVLRIAGEEKCV